MPNSVSLPSSRESKKHFDNRLVRIKDAILSAKANQKSDAMLSLFPADLFKGEDQGIVDFCDWRQFSQFSQQV